MEKRIFVRLDKPTLSATFQQRVDNNPLVQRVENDLSLYQFRFEEADIDHALMLLSESPSRFGYDLSPYLSTVRTFFQRTTQDQYILMPEGSADFKRGYSEDLGVAIASLFLVNVNGVKWETITQIPVNRAISKKTPDFMCLDDTDTRQIFEAKGTVRADRVDETIRYAKEQLGSYPEQGLTKLALVTYISQDPKLLPSFCFIADPPVATPLLKPDMLRKLHFDYVLRYVGLEETAEALRRMLSAELALLDENTLQTYSHEVRHKEASNAIFSTFSREESKLVKKQFADREWLGQQLAVSSTPKPLSVYLGVEKNHIERMLRYASTRNPDIQGIGKFPHLLENRTGRDDRPFSIFRDGTLYLVESI